MAYSVEVVEKVRNEFDKKRQKAYDDSVVRQEEVYSKCSVIKEIDEALSKTGVRVYEASVMGQKGLEKRIESLKNENLELQRQKRELLKMRGFSEDYTDIKYECNKCNDTGYVGIDMCVCMKSALAKASYESSGLGKALSGQSFDNFKLVYYSDEVKSDGSISDRELMKSNVAKAKKYVADFGKDGKDSNLLFLGDTGLGKTFMTNCIANELIKRGKNVLYQTAPVLLETVIDNKMSKNKKSGPAIFMYCVIGITLITSIICFTLYYGEFYKNGIILWVGITAFTIMYHFWVRIIMGNVSKLFKNYIKI